MACIQATKPIKDVGHQLFMCTELGFHNDALVDAEKAKSKFKEVYRLLKKQNAGSGNLKTKETEYNSLDACLAKMSIASYANTIAWTLSYKNGAAQHVFCLIANESKPFSAIYIPQTGEFITFSNASLEDARTYLIEKQRIDEDKPIQVIAATVQVKEEPSTPPMPPPPPVTTPVAEQSASEASEPPAAPQKKKVVRKRTTPTAAAAAPAPQAQAQAQEEPVAKKLALDEAEKK
ncbi:MAG: hypothetical protein K2Q45_06735 [Nitrosomonas sp.]|nr:hypothetical protein [Nitrosomonas sp.]